MVYYSLACVVALTLTGCSPVTHTHSMRDLPSYYHVRRGDTLYTIAWRFSVDVRDLIGWNRITPPYTIYPGQKLVMSPPPGYRRLQPTVVAQRVVPVHGSPVATRPLPNSHPASVRPSRAPGKTVRPIVNPGHSSAGKRRQVIPKPLSQPTVANRPIPSTRPASAPSTVASRPLRWSWPIQGQVVRHFNATLPGHQGIEIRGRNGEVVKAAEAGTVVYSGDALKGYGELIIIQHSADYLSAYANNRERYVREGDKVHRGEKIAVLGDRYTNAPLLHFEVRFRGKPVNPLDYLSGPH